MLEYFTTGSRPAGRKAGFLRYTHLVLYVDDKKANRLNDKALIIRWHKLCKGTVLRKNAYRMKKLTKKITEQVGFILCYPGRLMAFKLIPYKLWEGLLLSIISSY